jgi:hypothetical protein
MSDEDQQRWRERSRSPIPRTNPPNRSRTPDYPRNEEDRRGNAAPRRIPEHPPVDPSEHLSFFNLERNLREEDLEREVMDVIGYSVKFTIARDGKTRLSKGFGFVKLESVQDAIKVKEVLHDKVFFCFMVYIF